MKTAGLPTIRVGTQDVACQVEGPQGAPALLDLASRQGLLRR